MLIGNSYGSHIALNYSIHYPLHTSRIILTASPGTDNSFRTYYSDNIEYGLSKKELPLLDKAIHNLVANLSDENWMEYLKISMISYAFDEEVMPNFFDSLPPGEIPIFLNFQYQYIFSRTSFYENFDISKEVYALEQPIRIIMGRQDPLTSDIQVILNERAKHSKLIFIERAGHLPWLEQPSAFFTALRKSLND